MDQVVTGRFDALHQAEGAATKLRTIRANDVEISEWNGSSSIRAEQPDDRDITNTNFGFGMVGGSVGMGGASGMSGFNSGVSGSGAGYSTGGFGFLPYMQDDQNQQMGNQGYILNAVVPDEQIDRAVRIIREAGGREF